MQRLTDAIATIVTRRRGAVLAFIAVLTLATGAWLPTLDVDPRPQQLTVSSLEDQGQINAAFAERFGNPDHVVVLLVSAEDVLDAEPLAYVHRLATAFAEEPSVVRVEGITVTPLPVPVEEGGSGEGLDDLDTLDDLDDPDGGEDVDPEVEEALGVLVRTSPERFPMGLGTIADRMGGVEYRGAIEGDEVTEAERLRLRALLEDAPLVEGRLISEDRTLAAVALFLDESVDDPQVMQETVRSIDARLAELPPPPGVSIATGGLPHLFNSIIVKMEHDNFRIVPLTLLVCLALLYLSFRWIPGTFLPVTAVGLSAVMIIGSMALFGETMNVINNIIPPLLIIIGVSDSIHLIGRYREELEHAESKLEAARNTVRSMAVACFLTSITTAVGLASLVVSQTEMLQRFGVIAGAGVMLAYVVTIGFLPSAMTFFKPPLSREELRKKRAVAAYRDPAEGDVPQADTGLLESGIVWLTSLILERPWPFLVGALLACGGLVYTAIHVDVDSALLDEFDEEDDAFRSTTLMEEKLEGVRPLEIMLEADDAGRFHDPDALAAIDETEAWLRGQPAVLGTLASTDFLHESWARVTDDPAAAEERFQSREQVDALALLFAQTERDPLQAFVAEDGRVTRIQVRLADVGAAASLVLIRDLRAHLDERFGPLGVRVSMTGEGYTGSVGLDAVVRDLLGSLLTAVLIIFGMLVFLFGSWRLGLLSIPPNVIPLVGTMAWMAVREIPLNAATVIVFSISLGLAVDGSIHLLARYREEISTGLERNAALLRAARGTGRAVVVSCVTLMLGFGVMLLSSFVPVRRFGELIGVTVGMCLVSTLVVQPALLRVWAPERPPNRFRRGKSDA